MKKIIRILALISDINVSDLRVRKEIEDLDPSKIKKEDKEQILSLLREKRFNFFSEWRFETASGYM